MSQITARNLREAIINSVPEDTSLHGRPPEQKEVYTPPSHMKALRLECNLIIGSRGVGKSFWSAALRSDEIRRMLGSAVSELSLVKVCTGFGELPDIAGYPDMDVFQHLLSKGVEAYHVWRGVIARWLAGVLNETIPIGSWEETTTWICNTPEAFSQLQEQANDSFRADGTHGLIVFDALDRSSSDWRTMDTIVRDLLRVVLSLKRFPNLHAKVFLREDQFSGRQITDFPDASKLLATRVDLTWSLRDLHGLLWQYLCNGPDAHRALLREAYTTATGIPPLEIVPNVWAIADSAKRDEQAQRSLFRTIAGEWMGRDRRRGVPYTWSVGHLADGRGHTSPRSFLAAIRAAAEDSSERYSEHTLALHYESIKRGVQEASKIRVNELAEDYPWVKQFIEPLRGLTVPCALEAVEDRWKEMLGSPESIVFTQHRLPPEHLEEGWPGIKKDLESLGIFDSMKDGRINMPDLFRVGFGLGRRGGVRPMSSASKE
ncbi:MAG: hypothetical protein AB7E47_03685 [Desulfovibrionaceae bacterium]